MQELQAANTARTGSRRPKGTATKASQDDCAPKMLLRYEVEATAPALTDRGLCQSAAYMAALPTVRWLCQTKAALPDLGTKDPGHIEGGFAKATIVELRLRSRMLAAFAGSGPGTAAVASAAWSARSCPPNGGLARTTL